MSASPNPIVDTYSRLADQYDDELNLQSCWGRAAEKALASILIQEAYRTVLDVGCGTGRSVVKLAASCRSGNAFIGVEPAEQMRIRAQARAASHPNIKILDGRFEKIPLDSGSVDYLYSIFAFHWVTDLQAAVNEVARVLSPKGNMDLYFIGRNNGREFIRATSSIFLKHMGPARLLESIQLRKQLKKAEAFQLFSGVFEPAKLTVEESFDTYFDTLDGHWGWWVRIEGHFMQIPPEKMRVCDEEVKTALLRLSQPEGIPYTIHQLHVSLRN